MAGWLSVALLVAAAVLGPASPAARADHTIDLGDTSQNRDQSGLCTGDYLKIESEGVLQEGTHTYTGTTRAGFSLTLTVSVENDEDGEVDSIELLSDGSVTRIVIKGGGGADAFVAYDAPFTGPLTASQGAISNIAFCVSEVPATATPTPTPTPTATPTATPTPTGTVSPIEQPTTRIMIMKHVCPDSVQSVAQFDALGGFLAKVLTCPVVTLPGDEGPSGALDAGDDFFDQFVANGQIGFNFEVDAANGMWDLDDADFLPAKVCETDVNADANGDGMISADVCIEVSHYALDGVAEGSVLVSEVDAPDGFRFGSLEFSPMSGDADTLVSVDNAAGTILLDTTGDDGTSGDTEAGPRSIMLHVYNFANVTQPTPTPTPTATPTGDVEGETGTPAATLPPTDTAAGSTNRPADGWRLILLALAGLIATMLVLTPASARIRPR